MAGDPAEKVEGESSVTLTAVASPAASQRSQECFALVDVLRREAKVCMDRKDYTEALKKYSTALAFLAEARMLQVGLPVDDWDLTRTEAESACGPGEPWYFRVLWGAMVQASVPRDEEAAKLFSNLSLCHGRLGAWPQAQGAATAAMHLNPDWTKARYRLAEAQSQSGMHRSALTQARQARQGAERLEVAEVSQLQARVLSRAMKEAGVSLDTFDGLDVESVQDEHTLEEYKALAMLERDVFHSLPGWSEGIEVKTFPLLHATGDRVWDVDRPQPVRFDDYVQHIGDTEGGAEFKESTDWQAWAAATSGKIRAGLEHVLVAYRDCGD